MPLSAMKNKTKRTIAGILAVVASIAVISSINVSLAVYSNNDEETTTMSVEDMVQSNGDGVSASSIMNKTLIEFDKSKKKPFITMYALEEVQLFEDDNGETPYKKVKYGTELYAYKDIELAEKPDPEGATETEDEVTDEEPKTEYVKIRFDKKDVYVENTKVSDDPDVVLIDCEEMGYTIHSTPVYSSVLGAKEENPNTIYTLNNGTEITIKRRNSNYAFITAGWVEGIIETKYLSLAEEYRFQDVYEIKYSAGDASVFRNLKGAEKEYQNRLAESKENQEEEANNTKELISNKATDVSNKLLTSIIQKMDNSKTKEIIEDSEILLNLSMGEELAVVGTNDSEFYKVNVAGIMGYMLKSDIVNERYDIRPYLAYYANSNILYNKEAMLDGKVSTVAEDEKTEENLFFLAQLIDCEAGGEGYDGMRAVGTVVVNRMYVSGASLRQIVEAPKQFSPVDNGKIYRKIPSQGAFDAAYDVLFNDYRSFPCYVLSFQSIRNHYWSNQITYLVTYDDNWEHPQWFSYTIEAYNKYS